MAASSGFDQLNQQMTIFAEAMQLYDASLNNIEHVYRFSNDMDLFYICSAAVGGLVNVRSGAYTSRTDLVATLGKILCMQDNPGTITYRTYVSRYIQETKCREVELTKEFLRFVTTIVSDKDLVFNSDTDCIVRIRDADMSTMCLYDSLVLIGREFEKSLRDLQDSIIQSVLDLNDQEAFNSWLIKNPSMQITMGAIRSNLKLSQFQDMEMGFPRIRPNSKRALEPITPLVKAWTSWALELCDRKTGLIETPQHAFEFLNRRRSPILEFFKNIIEWFLSKLYPATDRLKKATMIETKTVASLPPTVQQRVGHLPETIGIRMFKTTESLRKIKAGNASGQANVHENVASAGI